MLNDSTAARCAEIYNLAWSVRFCSRPVQKMQRRAAISKLGQAVRLAFRDSDDFEPMLRAIADSLAGAWPP
jgi:hypothetical protein